MSWLKKMGLDSLDDLKARLKERIEEDYKQLSRGSLETGVARQTGRGA